MTFLKRYKLLLKVISVVVNAWSTRFQGRLPGSLLFEADVAVSFIIGRERINDIWYLNALVYIYSAAYVAVQKYGKSDSTIGLVDHSG